MTPQFLRDEAARFRGMAENTDREATKERFLTMAADYDARATVAHQSEEPNSGEAAKALNDPDTGEVDTEVIEVPKITFDRKTATGLKETVFVQRRPVGRPRREWTHSELAGLLSSFNSRMPT
jgi:hypothetical protein